MKKLISSLVLSALTACGVPPGLKEEPDPEKQPVVNESREFTGDGLILYQTHCEACHGPVDASTLLGISKDRFDQGLGKPYHKRVVANLSQVDREALFTFLNL